MQENLKIKEIYNIIWKANWSIRLEKGVMLRNKMDTERDRSWITTLLSQEDYISIDDINFKDHIGRGVRYL